MTNQFFALIEKRDAEKFRKFRTGKFNTKTDGILKKNNSTNNNEATLLLLPFLALVYIHC